MLGVCAVVLVATYAPAAVTIPNPLACEVRMSPVIQNALGPSIPESGRIVLQAPSGRE